MATLSELRQLASAKMIWSVPATDMIFRATPRLRVRDDGNYALVWLPPAKQDHRIAFIRTGDGGVIAKFPFGMFSGDAGFANGGAALWTLIESLFARYQLSGLCR